MKKFLITTVIVLTAIVGLSAAAFASIPTASNNPNAVVEYNIPGITSGTMQLSHFEKLFKMMPYDIQEKSVMAFNEIIVKQQAEFTYSGVKVKRTQNTWEFRYQGASVIVRNATDSDLLNIFRLPTI